MLFLFFVHHDEVRYSVQRLRLDHLVNSMTLGTYVILCWACASVGV